MVKKKKILIPEDMPEFHSDIEAMPLEDKIFVDKSVEIVDYIFQLMDEKEIKQKDLAEKMGKSEAEISKILGGMHNLTLRSIAKLEAAIGSTIVCVPPKAEISVSIDMILGSLKDEISKIVESELPEINYKSTGKVIKMNTVKNTQKQEAI